MARKEITIDKDVISLDSSPYIIAEMSANHNGKIDNALELIEVAKQCGANAVKMQTYTADTLTLKCNRPDFVISEGLWQGQTLHELYDSAYTPWDWHHALFAKAKDVGISLFSSPFDRSAVDLLESLDAPAYKVASFEAIDHPLISYMASTGKPLIISTGMASEREIGEAIEVAQKSGCSQLAVLHCISGYPTEPSDYNLRTLVDIGEKFDVLTGLSDHTISNTTALASVALGARIIEKHFTLDSLGGGADDSFSIMPDQLSALVSDCRDAWSAIGRVNYYRSEAEQANIKYRRSLYFVEDVAAGTVLTEKHVRSIRPGYGLAPKHYGEVIGMTLVHDVCLGTRVTWDVLQA